MLDGLNDLILPSFTLGVIKAAYMSRLTRGALLEGKDYAAATGRALRDIRRQVQMVFQDPYSSLTPRRTAEQIIAEPLEAYGILRSATEHPYTHTPLSAVPRPDPRGQQRRIVLESDVPSPTRVPSGLPHALPDRAAGLQRAAAGAARGGADAVCGLPFHPAQTTHDLNHAGRGEKSCPAMSPQAVSRQ